MKSTLCNFTDNWKYIFNSHINLYFWLGFLGGKRRVKERGYGKWGQKRKSIGGRGARKGICIRGGGGRVEKDWLGCDTYLVSN